MTEETNVEPVVETQTTTTEAEAPEVTAPETEVAETPAEPQESDVERERKRFERRIGRRTAELYKERAEKEQLAERIARLEASLTPREEQSVDPQQIEQFVRQQAKEIAAVERINEKCNQIADEGKRTFTDFNVALQQLAQETGPLFDRAGKPTPLMSVILESDAPAKVLHHLGTNPDIAADLADLNPMQLARRLVKIEAEMQAAPKQSSAPKPLAPTKGAASNDELHPGLSDADWIRRREKELRDRYK